MMIIPGVQNPQQNAVWSIKAFCKGERPEIKKLIEDICDGNEPDPGSLTKEELDYMKTAKVLLGHSLYSDSWLEL